ncbi:MAG TPA: Zn-binding domain-containing protein, partial [Vicinamibacterales bacterium]|nr:Zn-binding domain-containing protein [Vicinamibacterales bacterium]
PADEGQWAWTSESYPADAVSLRSVSSDNFVIVDTTREPHVIGETDFTSGPSTLHEKAIYIVEGKLYQVQRLDFDGRKAFVREIDCDYYTDAITYTRVTILDTFATGGDPAAAEPSHGEVHVVSRVVGFKKIKFYTNENVGSGDLDLPEQQMHTTSYWLTIPARVMNGLPYGADDRRDGIVGLSFAVRQIAQLLLMCDGHDIGISIDGAEKDAAPDRAPRVFVYDNYPGGIGFSRPLFEMHGELLDATRRLIAECECQNGCPGCVGPAGNTGPHAKAVALRILGLMAGEAAPSSEAAF